MEEYFKLHSTDYKKPLEISHWEALLHLKKLLEWSMFATLSLESDKHVIAGRTLKHLTKLLDRLHGIGRGYDEGMESRSIMVLANGMFYRLREELKNEGELLFGLMFLASWTLDVSIFAYCFLCSLLCVFHIFVLYWLCCLENQQCNK